MALIKESFLGMRPQELGRIKIGELGDMRTSRKGKKFQPPKKLDHFRIATMTRGPDGNFEKDEEMHRRVGEKPTELRGILMFDEVEENFHSEMALYRGRSKDGKILSCDGEVVTKVATGDTGPCPKANGKDCCARLQVGDSKQPFSCKPYGRLHIQLWDSPHTLGYHVFRTTSWTTVRNIQGALQTIYERFGTCYHAPVKLIAYPSEDRHESGVSTSLKVGLVLAMSMEEAAELIASSRQHLELARGDVKMLAAAVREDQDARDADEAHYIADEFAPPSTKEIIHDALEGEDEDEAEGEPEIEDEDEPEGDEEGDLPVAGVATPTEDI